MTSGQLYLSENVIVTVQTPPVFSNTWLNGASKKTDFEVKYLANGMRYGQSLYGVSIGNTNACLSGTLLGFDPE